MEYEDKIIDVLADALDYICKNPLIFVSETDIHSLVTAKLMKIPGLGPRDLYDTSCSLGLNKDGKLSKSKYKTMAVHKEYGHRDIRHARSDIVIINPDELAKIDDQLNLKHGGNWLVPDYIFEFGTEKAAKSETVFKEHLESDINKVSRSKKKGYVIHVQRNLCQLQGGRLSANRSKYEGYSKVIKDAVNPNPSKIKILVILVDIGNAGRPIFREGKVKIFKTDKFVGVNQKSLKEEIRDSLK